MTATCDMKPNISSYPEKLPPLSFSIKGERGPKLISISEADSSILSSPSFIIWNIQNHTPQSPE